MPDTTEQLDRVSVTLVYTGVVLLQGNVLGVQFREVEEGSTEYSTLGASYLYDKKIKKHFIGSPGSTYSVEMTTDRKSIYSGTAQYTGRWWNREEAALWQAESRVIEERHHAKNAAKKDSKTNELFDSLAVAREAYRRAVGANRAHVLAIIVESIVNG